MYARIIILNSKGELEARTPLPHVVMHENPMVLTPFILRAHLMQWQDYYQDDSFPRGFLNYLREIGYRLPTPTGVIVELDGPAKDLEESQ